jgi:spore maturation protein CgeB
MRGLAALGHEVRFLEREKLWYANNRDLAAPGYGHVNLYTSLARVKDKFAQRVRDADLVVVGSYVPEGIEAGKWVTSIVRGATAFYDLVLSRLPTADPIHSVSREISNACIEHPL